MQNPFGDLKNKREIRERQLEQAAKRQRTEREALYAQTQKVFDECSDMVMGVLEQLRSAVYPSCEIAHSRMDCSWRIYYRQGVYEEPEMDAIKVSLQMGPGGVPYLSCARPGQWTVRKKSIWGASRESVSHEPVNSALSREDLVLALRRLHPANEV